ncbi:MAG: hypothetical protein KAX10_03470 [Candidatus Lokiarchaeota archaeon]|nr:hypothetical protein [Candidatus Lokiarchaeota archaeon]
MKLKKEQFKIYNFFILLINLITLVLGIIYFTYPICSILWDILGVIMIIAWFGTFGLIFIIDLVLVKTDKIGKKINHFCYYCLVFYVLAWIFLLINAGLSSIVHTADMAMFTILGLITYIGFFGMALFGIYLAYLDIKYLENRGAWNFE